MKIHSFFWKFQYRLLWAVLAALLLCPALWAQNIIVTPPDRLSSGGEDNEIVIAKDKIAFIDRNSKDTCAIFYFKKNNPYYKPQLPKFSTSSLPFEGRGYERYDLSQLTQKEVINLYGLQNTPAPIPSDFKFGSVRIMNSAISRSDIVIVKYGAAFAGWCSPGSVHNCGGELLLARKNTLLAINAKGEIIWRWYDYYNSLSLELTENGKYLGIAYGTIAEDYEGDYFWPVGIQIVETANATTIFKQDLGQVTPLTPYGNIFVLELGGGKDITVLTKFDTEKRIIYTLSIKDSEWITRFTKGNYKSLGRGFIWDGKTYLWDKDFKQTPFNQPLKLQQP